MAGLVEEFKGCILTDNHIKKILSKTKDRESAYYMVMLVNSLIKCNVKVKVYIELILDKLKDKQNTGYMAQLITEFQGCNLTKDYVEKILRKSQPTKALLIWQK